MGFQFPLNIYFIAPIFLLILMKSVNSYYLSIQYYFYFRKLIFLMENYNPVNRNITNFKNTLHRIVCASDVYESCRRKYIVVNSCYRKKGIKF